MKVYVCGACGYEYDPAVGDPEDWVCPICGMGKDVFEEK